MDKGWIKLHRSIQDSWIWEDCEKYDKTHAWIDLLLSANHKDKKISVDGQPKVISRGQFLTSLAKLAARWRWNAKSVSRFLNILEKDKMIVQSRTHRWTTVTIVNYGVYQALMDESMDVSMDNYMDDYMDDYMDVSMDTNKNVKKEKNIKNEKNERIRSIFYPNDELLNDAFKEYVLMRKKIKKPFSTDHAIDLAIRKLDDLSGGDNDKAIAILNQSIVNSWQGLFPLKDEKQFGNKNTGIDWSTI